MLVLHRRGRRTPELTDGGGTWRPNRKLTRPARVRSVILFGVLNSVVGQLFVTPGIAEPRQKLEHPKNKCCGLLFVPCGQAAARANYSVRAPPHQKWKSSGSPVCRSGRMRLPRRPRLCQCPRRVVNAPRPRRCWLHCLHPRSILCAARPRLSRSLSPSSIGWPGAARPRSTAESGLSYRTSTSGRRACQALRRTFWRVRALGADRAGPTLEAEWLPARFEGTNRLVLGGWSSAAARPGWERLVDWRNGSSNW